MLLLAVAGLTAPAAAQCEPEPEPAPHLRAVARENYTRGVEASSAERWMEAREAFQQAYEVAPFAPVVYNLATAQAQTGQLVEAAESYREFLRRCQSQQTPELRADAQQLLAGVTPRIGRLTLRVSGISREVDAITLDDEALSHAVLGSAIPINPGRHDLRIVREGEGELETRQLTIDEGERRTVELSVPEYVAPVGGGEGGSGQVTTGGDDTGVIVGVLIGVVLAVGAAIAIPTAIVLGGQGSGEQPVEGTWPAARLPLIAW